LKQIGRNDFTLTDVRRIFASASVVPVKKRVHSPYMFLHEWAEHSQEAVRYYNYISRSWEWKIVKRSRLNRYIKEARKNLCNSKELTDKTWRRYEEKKL